MSRARASLNITSSLSFYIIRDLCSMYYSINRQRGTNENQSVVRGDFDRLVHLK